jgi:hypothetical protein
MPLLHACVRLNAVSETVRGVPRRGSPRLHERLFYFAPNGIVMALQDAHSTGRIANKSRVTLGDPEKSPAAVASSGPSEQCKVCRKAPSASPFSSSRMTGILPGCGRNALTSVSTDPIMVPQIPGGAIRSIRPLGSAGRFVRTTNSRTPKIQALLFTSVVRRHMIPAPGESFLFQGEIEGSFRCPTSPVRASSFSTVRAAPICTPVIGGIASVLSARLISLYHSLPRCPTSLPHNGAKVGSA